MTDWQPIETAQIKGYEQNPHVLVFQPEVGVFIARYELDNVGDYEWFLLDSCACGHPSHWMPLPAPPNKPPAQIDGAQHQRAPNERRPAPLAPRPALPDATAQLAGTAARQAPLEARMIRAFWRSVIVGCVAFWVAVVAGIWWVLA